MKTRAAVLYEPNTPFRVETLDLAAPREGDVLVKIRAAGVCHSDWHIATGDTKHPLPCVCGHEGAGVVQAIGSKVTFVKPGDHVALNWAPFCGSCFYCSGGRPALCEAYTGPVWSGVLMDGTPRLSKDGAPVYHYCALACFAEYAVVPKECCIPIPRELPWDVAALLGCAVTTGVGAAVNTVTMPAGAKVVVLGAGGVGLCAVMGAQAAGAATIIAVDRNEGRAAAARAFGATHTLASGADLPAQVKALTEGRGADFVFEAVGLPKLQEACLELVRPGGTVVLVGLSPMGTATNLPGAVLTRKEITVCGSYYGTSDTTRDFPRFIEWYHGGKLPLDALITERYTLEQINEAYADLLAGKLARGVIVFDD